MLMGPKNPTRKSERGTRNSTVSAARQSHPYPPPFGLRDDQVADALVRFASLVPCDVHLHPVRMNVVRLVVEPQRGRARRAEAEVGLRDVDREVDGVVIPRGAGDG